MSMPAPEGWLRSEVRLPPGSPLLGRTLADAGPRRRWGIGVVAIRRESPGDMVLMPGGETRFESLDLVLCVGGAKELAAFAAEVGPA